MSRGIVPIAPQASWCVTVIHTQDTLGENEVARRANIIMMDEDSSRVIRRLPRGSRSRAVNAAIRERPGASRRRDASARLDALRERLPATGTDRIKGGPGASPAVIVTPDASVLLKWVLPSRDVEDTDGVLALRDEAVAGTLDMVVPQLWIYEWATCRRYAFPMTWRSCLRLWPTSA